MTTDGSVFDLLWKREIDDNIARKVQSRLHVTEELLQRLGLEKELEGHTGCVNCLEWNSTGEILASASDDVRIIIWDPFRHKLLDTISTNHHGNIFSVKFMPKTNDSLMVSGAADYMINLHDIKLHETVSVCSCHTSRVKRLAVCPDCPHLYWSAAEDGTVRQFDIRAPHVCRSDSPNILVSLKRCLGRLAEAKCLSVNPVRSELLAVGANDPFVRIYDRRMIRLTTTHKIEQLLPDSNDYTHQTDYLPEGCAEYFVAGHLRTRPSLQNGKLKSYTSTYVTFGANGRDLLVNLGGEQIYLFDIYGRRIVQHFNFRASPYYIEDAGSSNKGECTSPGTLPSCIYKNIPPITSRWIRAMLEDANADPITSRPTLPPRVETLRLEANDAFVALDYSAAVRLYNIAINLCKESAVLYGNRAAALMKRDWDGDIYAALRDCQKTLELESNHYKAHFRMIRCLHELQWTTVASDCLKVFKNKYPSHAQSNACRALEKDIETARVNKEKEAEEMSKTDKEEVQHHAANRWDFNLTLYRPSFSPQEEQWQQRAFDYEKRYCGHCNTTTDIKEANFFGEEGQFIVAGSDDGYMYFWDRNTTNNLRILRGDGSIVNCLQPHPTYCLLASSGIDPVVRLWSPLPEDGRKDDREVSNKDVAASANQRRMRRMNPFDVFDVMMNMGYNPEGANSDASDDDEDFMNRVGAPNCACRPS
ncbi:WD and tetratricopeptide repeats protein 1-like [Thrips palmi]|uniref:WD and tetratricopeptide repeats protein 1-like n=1 Tax=Thrips palmi TaxID=161013 RepID=A0A6P9ABM2_THRPL|nr:WD and tetratricopeptide repeats protein 1-like [Thrips palmi]